MDDIKKLMQIVTNVLSEEKLKTVLSVLPQDIVEDQKLLILHEACGANMSIEIIELLLSKMSDEAINVRDFYGQSIFHIAVARNMSPKVIKLIASRMTKENIDEPLLLHVACNNRAPTETIEFLMSIRSPELIDIKQFERTVLHLLCEHKPHIDGLDLRHSTCFKKEALGCLRRLDAKSIELLLSKMSQEAINAKDNTGKTALDLIKSEESKIDIALEIIVNNKHVLDLLEQYRNNGIA